jgi:prevent-host-death family protein
MEKSTRVPLARVKDELSRYLSIAEQKQIVITRHGRPAGMLIGFATEENWKPVVGALGYGLVLQRFLS